MTAVLDAGELGRTTVPDSVVRRLATQALREIGVEADRQVDAQIRGQRVLLSARLAIAYPRSVAATTSQVREYLTERVGALTGLSVQRVDVLVTRLVAATEQTGRVR
ncbi:Asp23/Gls24 family envelope stress response protein [Pseudonocardiaceae bacterium YIM PH 21723]|nr:Asp23/Gls24 family envelope stress response protein [Pseudonocardiaceae bacterium YIM PH 21723]